MRISPEVKRAALLRSKARAFATLVKSQYGTAHAISNDTIEWLTDAEVPAFFAACEEFGIIRRSDWKWEAKS